MAGSFDRIKITEENAALFGRRFLLRRPDSGSKNKPRNTRLHGIYVLRAVFEAALFFSADGARWPSNVLYQHSFSSPDALGKGLFRTYTQGSFKLHFNFG